MTHRDTAAAAPARPPHPLEMFYGPGQTAPRRLVHRVRTGALRRALIRTICTTHTVSTARTGTWYSLKGSRTHVASSRLLPGHSRAVACLAHDPGAGTAARRRRSRIGGPRMRYQREDDERLDSSRPH